MCYALTKPTMQAPSPMILRQAPRRHLCYALTQLSETSEKGNVIENEFTTCFFSEVLLPARKFHRAALHVSNILVFI